MGVTLLRDADITFWPAPWLIDRVRGNRFLGHDDRYEAQRLRSVLKLTR